MQTISATEFKARCLKLLDEVERTGEPLTITKRGRPVAQLVPPVPREKGYPQDTLRGSVRILGDIISPPLPPEAWDANRGECGGLDP